jgi:nucleoside-diphosphate-sugar epimerase
MFGPPIQQVTSYAALGPSVGLFWSGATQEEKPREILHNYVTSYVDVRDVAEIHVRALESDKAGGERFIADAGEDH